MKEAIAFWGPIMIFGLVFITIGIVAAWRERR